MRQPFLRSATLLALALLSSLALAADPPARVGRISLTQGEVNIGGDVGEAASGALVNWPITSGLQLTTGRDARTEFRVGSTAVRLGPESALEVTELDDERLRLHLHYGSVSVRVRGVEAVPGFELSTPQGYVRLQEPGRLRADAERVQDTTTINVFEGSASVEGGGAQLVVRAGRRADLQGDEVRTGQGSRDRFDDWAFERDAQDDRSLSARYVSNEMTGYEELDRNGVWQDDPDYGPLWMPRTVSADWAPYRDGRWAWIAPWGWTWIDNAPWGYAPSHYGRWVMVRNRWCWAPGRDIGRPVWAPALVGWVGGSGWSVSFNGGYRPAQGWYPLGPRETFVPTYRASPEHLQRINRYAREDWRNRRDDRHDGLTVVPHEQFGHRGTVVVPTAPRANGIPPLLQAPVSAPPAPQGAARDRREAWNNDGARAVGQPPQRGPREVRQDEPRVAAPAMPVQGRPEFGENRGRNVPQPMTEAPAPQAQPQRDENRYGGRPFRNDGERRLREPEQQRVPQMLSPPPQAQPQQMAQPQPQMQRPPQMPAPSPQMAPQPQQQAQPQRVPQPAAPAPQPAPQRVQKEGGGNAAAERKRNLEKE